MICKQTFEENKYIGIYYLLNLYKILKYKQKIINVTFL